MLHLLQPLAERLFFTLLSRMGVVYHLRQPIHIDREKLPVHNPDIAAIGKGHRCITSESSVCGGRCFLFFFQNDQTYPNYLDVYFYNPESVAIFHGFGNRPS